jgi:hypothetical protein
MAVQMLFPLLRDSGGPVGIQERDRSDTETSQGKMEVDHERDNGQHNGILPRSGSRKQAVPMIAVFKHHPLFLTHRKGEFYEELQNSYS